MQKMTPFLVLFVMLSIQNSNQVFGIMSRSGSSCPQRIAISSSGSAKTLKSRMGNYNLILYDDSRNGVYEHASNKGKFLYKINGNSGTVWMGGDELGEDFGWFGNDKCKSKCPNKCGAKTWQYWNEETGGWDFDLNFKVEGVSVPPPAKIKKPTEKPTIGKIGRTTEKMQKEDPSASRPNQEKFRAPQLGLEDAVKACKSFGGNFTVTRKAYGSLICSTVPWERNCHKCSTWRMLVWMDGACEKAKNDFTPCKANLQTKVGYYYCGHQPCTKDGDFPEGGIWGAGIKGEN